MSDSGAHTISGDGTAAGSEGAGCAESCLGLLAILLFFAAWIYIDLDLGLEEPEPPPQKQATFYSDPTDPNPLVLTLSGGRYALQYIVVDSVEAHRIKIDHPNALHVNFSTGVLENKGVQPNVIIVEGKSNLNIGSFDNADEAVSEFIIENNKIGKAHFMYNAPATGPPYGTRFGKEETVTIYVIGELASVTYDGTRGNSSSRVSILELDPSPNEREKYDSEMRKYEERYQQHREKVESRARYRPNPHGRGH